MGVEQVDVLIIGSGLAGIMTSLHLPKHLNVLLVSKGDITETNSYLAQGGVAAVVTNEDSPESHLKDTLACGHFTNNVDAVKAMVFGAKEAIRLIESEYGVSFDQNEQGYLMGMEGAHSKARILRMGDYTGKALMDTLYPFVKKRENTRHWTHTNVISLMVSEGICYGAWVIRDEELVPIYAKTVVMATGGIGHLFKHTTNAKGIVGDGVAMALRSQLKTQALSKIQFHPTGFFSEHIEERHFLISEAVRGEGAKLYNHENCRFMCANHPMNELAPRDVVAKAIYHEMAKEQQPYVWLDVTHLSELFLKERFPTIYQHCLTQGINISKDRIPCVPCQHYFMGGIQSTPEGITNVKGVYAIGECACTGVHGDNRLASNSLLEILVFSKNVAETVQRQVEKTMPLKKLFIAPMVCDYGVTYQSIQTLFERYLGIGSNSEQIVEGYCKVKEIRAGSKEKRSFNLTLFEIENALLVLEAILYERINKESQYDQSVDGCTYQGSVN